MGYGSGGGTDLFMEIIRSDGSPLSGSSMDEHFKEQIEIESFSFGGPSFEAVGGKKRKKKKQRLTRTEIRRLTPEEQREYALKHAEGEGDDEDDDFQTFSFVIRKEYDRSSPLLLESYCNNLVNVKEGEDKDLFQMVTIRCRIDTASDTDLVVLKMDFADAFVVEYDMEVDDETSIPTETIKFKFDKVNLTYTPQTGTGDAGEEAPAGWDFKNKEPWSS